MATRETKTAFEANPEPECVSCVLCPQIYCSLACAGWVLVPVRGSDYRAVVCFRVHFRSKISYPILIFGCPVPGNQSGHCMFKRVELVEWQWMCSDDLFCADRLVRFCNSYNVFWQCFCETAITSISSRRCPLSRLFALCSYRKRNALCGVGLPQIVSSLVCVGKHPSRT